MRAGMAELTDYERAQVHFEMNDYMEAARRPRNRPTPEPAVRGRPSPPAATRRRG